MTANRRRSVLRLLAVALLGLALVAAPRAAYAQPPATDLIAKLSVHAAQLEKMRTHASFAIDARVDHLDSDGNVSSVEELKARIDADGHDAKFSVAKYVDDGEDKTDDARKKAVKHNAKTREEKHKTEIRMPFHVDEQCRYVFDQVDVDRADPSRVRIAFAPKVRADNTIEGSAWVDTRTGTVISAGFKVSKTALFVDYVLITLEFGAPTAIGPAISKITMDGKGGVLFLRKTIHAVIALSDYRIASS